MGRFALCTLCLLLLFGSAAPAQNTTVAATTLKSPTRVQDYSLNATPRFLRFNQLPADVRTSLQAEGVLGLAAYTITSVPHWSGSFTTAGKKYGYAMVGKSPTTGGTTSIPTAILPITFVFDAYKDANGNKLSISASGVLGKATKSPNWIAYSYSTGHTQFADAVQRAEFYKTMGTGWHTLIGTPRMLKTAVVHVGSTNGKVFKTSSGVVYAEVSADMFETAMNKILPAAGLRSSELPIAIARNILLYSNGRLDHCCVLGFHTAYQSGGTSSNRILQTFAWASWLDKGIFKNTDIADVMALSHEVSEWMDDPFVNNATPTWEYPDNSGCQNNLETGDPVEVLANLSNAVYVSGFNYHPQTEALLQWFSRESPSSAIHGAYSYPDLSALRTASKSCTAP
jgi:hypothetical protein